MQIVLHSNLKIDIFLLNSYFTSVDVINSDTDVQVEIDKVKDMILCIGGPNITQYKNIAPRCAYKDLSQRWRHNRCPLKIENGVICKFCASLEDTFRYHVDSRKRNHLKEQIHLTSPSKKRKLEIIRKAARVQAQTSKRRKASLENLKDEINRLRDEISKVEDRVLEDLLEKKQINDVQVN